jgi:phosphoribosyl 1,2-cyclic phosphodiesterase
MPLDLEFSVRFWGVRGSIATSDPGTTRYGGNTSSLEIRCGGRCILLDGGTGLRYLGNDLVKEGKPIDADLFLTHTHFDHVSGIPFFTPFFMPQNKFRIRAGHLLPEMTIKKVLQELMMAPLFPVPPEIFQADIEYKDFECGETIDLGDNIVVRTAALNHPNRATGYRFEYNGGAICYITDTEHVAGELDQNILGLIKDADIVIYDSMFTEEEFQNRIGWGHSTWQAGAELCDAGNVGTFVVFHHDPDHNDDFMDGVAKAASERRPGTIVAREGMVLRP